MRGRGHLGGVGQSAAAAREIARARGLSNNVLARLGAISRRRLGFDRWPAGASASSSATFHSRVIDQPERVDEARRQHVGAKHFELGIHYLRGWRALGLPTIWFGRQHAIAAALIISIAVARIAAAAA